MSVTTIRPFTVPVTSEAELEALRARVAATRWPDRGTRRRSFAGREASGDHRDRALLGDGVRLAPVRGRLAALPHFITEIDGLDIHFIHVRSKHDNALPVIITHGWPGSVIELLKIIDPLTNPTAHGGAQRTPSTW